ncbi:hypothetical protein FY534_05795 [Alicyclobacillus sp. TC]|uniref:hypothetical protein n=1 Tax=Alicyclobacillus sp. TC TaxID=2606450 RepID=UPI0019323068|nr:hypothetical protein [Alicyclobacillus sp. TC]QRF23238.1 hypothetical protein FY534_05795 [Alicyclobacillus sp. TC]
MQIGIQMIGSILTLTATSGIGFSVARSYRDRPKQIALLAQGLRLLRQEVEFAQVPLPLALSHVADLLPKPVNLLFRQMATNLEEQKNAGEAIDEAIVSFEKKLAMQKEDYEPLRTLGAVVATAHRTHLARELDTALIRLQSLEEIAETDRRKNEKVWRYLGVLVGVMIVIMMS